MRQFKGYCGLKGYQQEVWFEFELQEESTKLDIEQSAINEVLKQIVWGYFEQENDKGE